MKKLLSFLIAIAILSTFLGTAALAVPFDPGFDAQSR